MKKIKEAISHYRYGIKCDILKRKDAEIERLQKILVGFMDEVETWSNKYDVDISTIHKLPLLAKEDFNIRNKIKAEAIKEFAEKLKENTIDVDVSYGYGKECYTEAVAVIEIDDLVKEMVGDENA